MGRTATWNGYGWQHSNIGRAKIKAGVRPYGGRWVDLIEINGDKVVLFIHPVERHYRMDEIEKIDISPSKIEVA